MTPERPSERRKRIVAEYVHWRLEEEIDANPRGRAAHIARETHFTPAHISDLKNGKKPAGEDVVAALASYWEEKPEELQRKAEEWFAGRTDQAATIVTRARSDEMPEALAAVVREAANAGRPFWPEPIARVAARRHENGALLLPEDYRAILEVEQRIEARARAARPTPVDQAALDDIGPIKKKRR